MIEQPDLRALAAAVEAARRADQQVREEVASARAVGHSWAAIGDVLGLSRQAAHQRYGAVDRLVCDWAEIEDWARRIAERRGWDAAPVEVLKQLRREDLLSEWEFTCAAQLHELRNRAVRDGVLYRTPELAEAIYWGVMLKGLLAALYMRPPAA
jgi:hypothetical protein